MVPLDLSDFISRIDGSKVNKRVIETLIKSGAFDGFNFSRKALLENLEYIVETVSKAAQAKKMAVGSLFGDDDELTTVNIDITNCEEFEAKEILEFEKNDDGTWYEKYFLTGIIFKPK